MVLLRNGSKHVTGDAEDWRTLPASGCAQIPVPTRTQGATPGTARDTLIAILEHLALVDDGAVHPGRPPALVSHNAGQTSLVPGFRTYQGRGLRAPDCAASAC